MESKATKILLTLYCQRQWTTFTIKSVIKNKKKDFFGHRDYQYKNNNVKPPCYNTCNGITLAMLSRTIGTIVQVEPQQSRDCFVAQEKKDKKNESY